jgi:4-amino-4-deoxy-L-arabinose transferase-like glycosyltransferase
MSEVLPTSAPIDCPRPPLQITALAASERSRLGDLLLIFVFCLLMHVPWLGVTPLAGTEAHRVFPAREMLHSGYWAVPMLYGKPYATKPPLHHWLIAFAEWVSGQGNVFVWRLPSAVVGAVLSVVLCWFAARWFGRTAGMIAGLSSAGMVTLWGQWQVADIDSTNTLASALAALCLIELLIARPKRVWPWVLAAGLALAATLMVKGPGGIPIILAAWILGVIAACLRPVPDSQAEELRFRSTSPTTVGVMRLKSCLDTVAAFVMPLVIGSATFAAYAWWAYVSLHRQGFGADLAGVKEGSEHLIHLPTLQMLGKSLLVMPTQLFLFALPVSLALPLLLVRKIREGWNSRERRLMAALAASVLISWGICVLGALDNPRYGYVTLPPLCVLAGAVAMAAARNRPAADWLRAILIVTAAALSLAAAGLAWAAWRLPHFQSVLVASVFLAVATATGTIVRLRSSWRAAWGFVPLLVFAVIPFSLQRAYDRTRSSGFQTALILRQRVGDGASIAAGGAVTSKPETFYYADARVNFFTAGHFLPANVPPGTWVILDKQEHDRWLRSPGVRLDQDKWLCRNGTTDYYLAWYASRSR